MTTVKEVFNTIEQEAEKIQNDLPQRFSEAASDGDTARQGDLYIIYCESLPKNCDIIEKPNSQLAEGNTQGSRHILDSLVGVEMYDISNKTVLDGPVMKTTQERTITHPEHADIILPPGVYKIRYQRQHAEELRRQRD